ncbi:sulfhydryl oxidase 2 [Drosophila suzukii]|uniref:Sulfhydryl oxidase n=1 Tax=Drosophila suzukii TaxID=28584 RepID=A0AB40A9Y8_DROSZ
MNRYLYYSPAISLLLCTLLFPGLSQFLYNPDDNVEQLDFASFESGLSEPTTGKLVKFFNGFCKDSQHFMPAFRKLSRKLYKWKRILKVHVFDCAKDENLKICRSFIIRSTPTLRFFPTAYHRDPEDLGTEISSRNVKEIESELALYLAELKYFKLFSREDNVKDIFRDHEHVKYIAMVFQMCLFNFMPHFETGNSMEEKQASLDDCNKDNPIVATIGRNTLLELLPYNEIAVRVFDDHQVYTKFNISPVPNLIVILNRNIKPLFLTPEVDTSEAYVAAIRQFLEFSDFKPHKPLLKTLPTNITEALRYEIFKQHKNRPQQIYRADLERAVDQILKVELPKTSNFVGKRLSVVNNFLRQLYYLSPLKPEAKEKLNNLYNSMKIKSRVSGVKFKELVLKALKNYTFDGKQYVGCIASRSFLRGFNCSFWALFHYLTVESESFHAGAVVQVFNGFVKFFMDCNDCRNNLREFKKIRPLSDVTQIDQEILWLWEAHNYINKQLAGGSSEDPKFPKIQFPSERDCPSCRDNQSEWRTDEVLKYLKSIYSLKNLSWFGMASDSAYTYSDFEK